MSLTLRPELDETLRGQSLAIQSRTRTCREVFERCRAIVDEQDSVLQAWVNFGGDAVEQTVDERDAELRQGIWRGPLHGIPIGVKDIYDVEGLPTRSGIPNRTSPPASADSTMVRRLRRSGGIR